MNRLHEYLNDYVREQGVDGASVTEPLYSFLDLNADHTRKPLRAELVEMYPVPLAYTMENVRSAPRVTIFSHAAYLYSPHTASTTRRSLYVLPHDGDPLDETTPKLSIQSAYPIMRSISLITEKECAEGDRSSDVFIDRRIHARTVPYKDSRPAEHNGGLVFEEEEGGRHVLVGVYDGGEGGDDRMKIANHAQILPIQDALLQRCLRHEDGRSHDTLDQFEEGFEIDSTEFSEMMRCDVPYVGDAGSSRRLAKDGTDKYRSGNWCQGPPFSLFKVKPNAQFVSAVWFDDDTGTQLGTVPLYMTYEHPLPLPNCAGNVPSGKSVHSISELWRRAADKKLDRMNQYELHKRKDEALAITFSQLAHTFVRHGNEYRCLTPTVFAFSELMTPCIRQMDDQYKAVVIYFEACVMYERSVGFMLSAPDHVSLSRSYGDPSTLPDTVRHLIETQHKYVSLSHLSTMTHSHASMRESARRSMRGLNLACVDTPLAARLDFFARDNDLLATPTYTMHSVGDSDSSVVYGVSKVYGVMMRGVCSFEMVATDKTSVVEERRFASMVPSVPYTQQLRLDVVPLSPARAIQVNDQHIWMHRRLKNQEGHGDENIVRTSMQWLANAYYEKNSRKVYQMLSTTVRFLLSGLGLLSNDGACYNQEREDAVSISLGAAPAYLACNLPGDAATVLAWPYRHYGAYDYGTLDERGVVGRPCGHVAACQRERRIMEHLCAAGCPPYVLAYLGYFQEPDDMASTRLLFYSTKKNAAACPRRVKLANSRDTLEAQAKQRFMEHVFPTTNDPNSYSLGNQLVWSEDPSKTYTSDDDGRMTYPELKESLTMMLQNVMTLEPLAKKIKRDTRGIPTREVTFHISYDDVANRRSLGFDMRRITYTVLDIRGLDQAKRIDLSSQIAAKLKLLPLHRKLGNNIQIQSEYLNRAKEEFAAAKSKHDLEDVDFERVDKIEVTQSETRQGTIMNEISYYVGGEAELFWNTEYYGDSKGLVSDEIVPDSASPHHQSPLSAPLGLNKLDDDALGHIAASMFNNNLETACEDIVNLFRVLPAFRVEGRQNTQWELLALHFKWDASNIFSAQTFAEECMRRRRARYVCKVKTMWFQNSERFWCHETNLQSCNVNLQLNIKGIGVLVPIQDKNGPAVKFEVIDELYPRTRVYRGKRNPYNKYEAFRACLGTVRASHHLLFKEFSSWKLWNYWSLWKDDMWSVSFPSFNIIELIGRPEPFTVTLPVPNVPTMMTTLPSSAHPFLRTRPPGDDQTTPLFKHYVTIVHHVIVQIALALRDMHTACVVHNNLVESSIYVYLDGETPLTQSLDILLTEWSKEADEFVVRELANQITIRLGGFDHGIKFVDGTGDCEKDVDVLLRPNELAPPTDTPSYTADGRRRDVFMLGVLAHKLLFGAAPQFRSEGTCDCEGVTQGGEGDTASSLTQLSGRPYQQLCLPLRAINSYFLLPFLRNALSAEGQTANDALRDLADNFITSPTKEDAASCSHTRLPARQMDELARDDAVHFDPTSTSIERIAVDLPR